MDMSVIVVLRVKIIETFQHSLACMIDHIKNVTFIAFFENASLLMKNIL